ncbi:MAG: GPP34 family phosphoprotein, partial [Eubacteriales bacterium]|nr:GPP34 family phosphoprotein [Eubacteriales bacterium]
MTRKSIAQEYFILTIDKNGYMPAMRKEECNAGLVAASVMDLLLHSVITMERKKITVVNGLPNTLEHLASLYAYLAEKPRSTDNLMQYYMLSTSSRIKQLTADIGESLFAEQAVTKSAGGLLGKQTVYIPQLVCKDTLAGTLRSAVIQTDTMSPHDTALLCLLQETKNLNQYFSKRENAAWKETWRTIKRDPQNKALADMVRQIDNMTALLAFWVV